MKKFKIFRLKRAIGACFLACIFLQAISAQAATYYVDTTGNDSNPGTEEMPWQTVAHAVGVMMAGDTTYVKGGLYNEGLIRFKRSGTKSAPIKLLNYPYQTPIINCIDPQKLHRVILENESGFQNPVGWITIEGFEIRNCYNGLKFHNAHDFIVRRNWIHDNLFQGVLGNGLRVLIDSNIINHNGGFEICATSPSRCNKDHGIYTSGTSFTIVNNLIYDNLAYGITLNGSPSSFYNPTKHAGPEFAKSQNWIIANNTVAYNKNRAGLVVWGSTCNNTRIENNIFYENGVNLPNSAVNGIDFVSTTCTGIQIRNNLSYASGAGAIAFLSSGAEEWIHYTQSGNIINTDNPQFVNAPAMLPASPNFALADRSPAIDKGLPLMEASTSFDGTTRPHGRAYDIGAYEHNADGNVHLRHLRPSKLLKILEFDANH